MTALSERDTSLRRGIVPLCHLIRWAMVAWIGWELVNILRTWGSRENIALGFGRYLKLDLHALPTADYIVSFALVLIDWSVAALVAVFVWKLFGGFLDGQIFSAASMRQMLWLGWAGVAAVATDLVIRPLVAVTMSMHLPTGGRGLGLSVQPQDLLHLLMGLVVVALAFVFKTGVEISDDHRQIV